MSRAKREEGQEDTPAFLSKYLPVLGHSTDASMLLFHLLSIGIGSSVGHSLGGLINLVEPVLRINM